MKLKDMNLDFFKRIVSPIVITIIVGFFFIAKTYSQQTDTIMPKHLYDPERLRGDAEVIHVDDTIPVSDSTIIDEARMQQIRDSLLAREQFVRDSLLAREKFIKDSIMRRQRMYDSVVFLQRQLPELLNAYFRTIEDDIIIKNYNIPITGDSALGYYSYLILPFSVSEPFIPWKPSYSLTGRNIRFTTDQQKQKIIAVRTPVVRCSFEYGRQKDVLIIHEQAVVQNNWAGRFYKTPIDSVFFDRSRRIVKIKRYVMFYSLVNSNQQGDPLFLNLEQVKQYEYGSGDRIMQYQVVQFCDRWKAYEANKVCSILTYTFTHDDGKYQLVRRNEPSNKYSDGTYDFEYDSQDNLMSISFKNVAGTENWERLVQMNDDGYVNCYMDKINGMIHQSLCMIYHPVKPGLQQKVETITTVFENDGISYYQKNNTTGQVRTRNKMTLEWSPWR